MRNYRNQDDYKLDSPENNRNENSCEDCGELMDSKKELTLYNGVAMCQQCLSRELEREEEEKEIAEYEEEERRIAKDKKGPKK